MTARKGGKALDLPEPEPWGEPVDGAELIADLVGQIRRYVVLSDHAALGAALWTIHSHAHAARFPAPRLTALRPTKRCGKSSLFRTLLPAYPPLAVDTASISPSAMFRVIEAASPTFLFDEMSSIGDKERMIELRGVVNSSHCRADAQVIRNVARGRWLRAPRLQHMGADGALPRTPGSGRTSCACGFGSCSSARCSDAKSRPGASPGSTRVGSIPARSATRSCRTSSRSRWSATARTLARSAGG